MKKSQRKIILGTAVIIIAAALVGYKYLIVSDDEKFEQKFEIGAPPADTDPDG